MRPTVTQLRAAFAYDPETGLFRWKQHRTRRFVGQLAGCLVKVGYISLSLKNRKIRAHVAAWAIYYGRYPQFDLDHWDLNKANNRIKNLRRADKSKNGANRPPLVTNTSGFKGVFWHAGAQKWMAQIRLSNRSHYLGIFVDPEDAAKAYDTRAIEHFGAFARTNKQLGLI